MYKCTKVLSVNDYLGKCPSVNTALFRNNLCSSVLFSQIKDTESKVFGLITRALMDSFHCQAVSQLTMKYGNVESFFLGLFLELFFKLKLKC